METELSNKIIVYDILLTFALLWTLGFLKTISNMIKLHPRVITETTTYC